MVATVEPRDGPTARAWTAVDGETDARIVGGVAEEDDERFVIVSPGVVGVYRKVTESSSRVRIARRTRSRIKASSIPTGNPSPPAPWTAEAIIAADCDLSRARRSPLSERDDAPADRRSDLYDLE